MGLRDSRRSRIFSAPSACFALSALAAMLAAAPARSADFAGGTLVVHRNAATADCPDEAALARATLALGALPAAPGPALHVELEFHHDRTGYVAQLRTSGSTEGVRDVAKEGDSCAPLAEAVTVILAVLFDLTPRETPPASAATAAGAAPGRSLPPGATPPPAEREGSSRPASLGVVAAGGAGYGLLGNAFVGTLSAAARPRLGHFELALGALWAPNRSVEFAPGRVLMSLLAFRVDGCAWLRSAVVEPDLGLCAGFLAGSLRAEGDGFLTDIPANDAWFAFEASAQGRWPFSRNVALQLAISLVVPARQQTFTVANAGVAFESSPVAGLLELGPELRFP
jgi:hypothetical protein